MGRSTSTEAAALLDRHLLDGVPTRTELVAELLAHAPPSAAAKPFFEGLRIVGPRTPDLALVALRLVLAGRRADDETVVRVKRLVEAARRGGREGEAARKEYAEIFQELP